MISGGLSFEAELGEEEGNGSGRGVGSGLGIGFSLELVLQSIKAKLQSRRKKRKPIIGGASRRVPILGVTFELILAVTYLLLCAGQISQSIERGRVPFGHSDRAELNRRCGEIAR